MRDPMLAYVQDKIVKIKIILLATKIIAMTDRWVMISPITDMTHVSRFYSNDRACSAIVS